MLSRARRVGQLTEPFDWNAGATQLASRRALAAPVEAAPPDLSEDQQRRQRLAAAERDGFARGYAEGERAGAEVAAQRADAMLRRLTQTIEELSALRNEVLRGAEQQVLRLAMAIARRVLAREIAVDRGLLLAMARIALERLGERTSAIIRLHPDDYAAIGTPRGEADANEHVQIVADPIVGRGGCLVQSDFGLMEVGLDAQFGELARTLLGEAGEMIVPDPSRQTHASPERG
jgi:flagellar assembly protein FliH